MKFLHSRLIIIFFSLLYGLSNLYAGWLSKTGWFNKTGDYVGNAVLRMKTTIPGGTFYNLTIAADTCEITQNITVLNNLTVQKGCVLKATDDTIFIYGDWNMEGNFDAGNSIIIFKGASQQLISASKFHTIIIAKEESEVIATGELDIDGDFIIFNGKFDPGNYTHYVKGNWIDTGGKFNPSYGTVVFNGIDQIILQSENNYFNDLTVSGNLTLTHETVKIRGNLTVNSEATLTLDSLAKLKLGGTDNKVFGTFIAKGLAPLITSITPGVTYYRLRLKGKVDISRLWIEYIGKNGLVIDTEAAIMNLNNICFNNVESTALTIYRDVPFSGTLSGLSFDTTCIYNIHANGDKVNIFLKDYAGAHSGEKYNRETNGATITWEDSSFIDIKWTYQAGRNFTTGIISSAACRPRDGNLFISTQSGSLIALTPNGSKIWARKLNGYVKSSAFILVCGDTLFVPTTSGTLYAMNANDGNMLWKIGTSDSVVSGAVINNNLIWFGCANDTFYAVDFTGLVQLRIGGTPANAYHEWLQIMSGTKTMYWSQDDKVYFCDKSGNLCCVSEAEIPNPWGWATYPLNFGAPIRTWPIVWDNVIYFGCDNGYFYAVDAKTGKPIWKLHTGLTVRSSPIIDIARGTVIFGSREGKLYCIGITKKGMEFEEALKTCPKSKQYSY